MKSPKASGALRWAPDPMPRYAHFARRLHAATSARSGGPELGPPLTKSWIRYCYHHVEQTAGLFYKLYIGKFSV